MKALGLLAVLLGLSTGAEATPRVLIVINEGFQIDEYFTPKAIYEENGFEVKTASRYGGWVKPGRSYQAETPPVKADLSFQEIKVSDYDAISFTGGGGAWSDYFPVKNLHQVLAEALQNPKITVGLICAASGLLATANNLDGKTPIAKGRHVTGYGDVAGLLLTQGQMDYDAGDLTKPYVVQDGNLITGRDPSSAKLFGETVAKKLGGK